MSIDLTKLCGTWVQDQGDVKIILTLSADGTYTERWESQHLYLRAMAALMGDMSGKWIIGTGDTLTLRLKTSNVNLYRWTGTSWWEKTRQWTEENVLHVPAGKASGDSYYGKITKLTDRVLEFEHNRVQYKRLNWKE
jgi:hypothetical protein